MLDQWTALQNQRAPLQKFDYEYMSLDFKDYLAS